MSGRMMMKKIILKKYKVDELGRDHNLNLWYFITSFKSQDYVFHLTDEEIHSTNSIKAMTKFHNRTHDLFLYTNGNTFVKLEAKASKVLKGSAIDKFVVQDYDPMYYVNYYAYDIFTQLDGITAIVGMTGGGKTYSALAMLPTFANIFTHIAYLNYELTERDIDRRLRKMYNDDTILNNIFDKLYLKEGVMTSLNIEEILEDMNVNPNDRVVFIIDNVGSVIGQEDNVWKKQNEFLKDIDTLCKERGYHALALTQIIKDHQLKLFDDNGDFLPSITASIMSGSIVLANLARTVMLTGFNKNSEFKRKVLKKGTALYYSDEDVKKEDVIEDAIKR